MDKNKTDLVPIKLSLPSASTGGRKILSTVMADALVIAKGFKNPIRHEEFQGGVYEGQWSNGLPNGKGKWTHPDGDLYEGEWLND